MSEGLRLRRQSVTWREVEGELVALDLERSVYLASNLAGSLLWKALADGASRQALIDLIVSTFGVDAEQAAADVDDYLAQLMELGLLEG